MCMFTNKQINGKSNQWFQTLLNIRTILLKHKIEPSYWNICGGLLKHNLLVPIPRVSDSVSLQWVSVIFISNKSPGVADDSSVGTTFLESKL